MYSGESMLILFRLFSNERPWICSAKKEQAIEKRKEDETKEREGKEIKEAKMGKLIAGSWTVYYTHWVITHFIRS